MLLEISAYEHPRVGEVLPAIARPLLTHLGIWEGFEAEQFRRVHSQAAAWGQPSPVENHFIYSAWGAGWHLERSRFDRFLAAQVALQGIDVRLGTRVGAITPLASPTHSHWQLQLTDGSTLQARFLVDATGRRAIIARKMQGNPQVFDQLTAFVGYFDCHDAPQPGTLIEAFPQGWWYTALTDQHRIIACLTDVDIARDLGLKDRDRWQSLLRETRWMQSRIGEGLLQGEVIVRPANSTCLDRVYGNHWLAVGDAASAYDPLSSQGITKALRFGIFAGYAIGDWLVQGDKSGLTKYASLVQREFQRYRQAHCQYCREEQRWPQDPFWQKRQKR